MKPESTFLRNFIDKEFSDILPSCSRSLFSDKSRHFLSGLYTSIKEADQSFHENISSIYETDIYTVENSEFTSTESYSFIPAEIRKTVEQSKKWGKKFKFTHNASEYSVGLVYPLHMGKKTPEKQIKAFFHDVIYKIYMWLYVVQKYASSKCSKKMTLYFLFSDHKKQLSRVDGEIIDKINVNTAFTTSCNPSTEIHLFRKEEWFKVFIHETFHNLGLDFSELDCSSVDSALNSIFPVYKEFRLYESYCETWAEIIYFLFFAFLESHPSDKMPAIFKRLDSILRYESIHSGFQCAKILNHNHITYDQLIDSNSTVARNNYKEKTYVLSYYVVKSIFFIYLNDFVEWCFLKNSKTNPLNFKKDEKTMMQFVALVNKLYKTPKYTSFIRKIESWIATEKYKKYDDYIMKNLRMTLHEK